MDQVCGSFVFISELHKQETHAHNPTWAFACTPPHPRSRTGPSLAPVQTHKHQGFSEIIMHVLRIEAKVLSS